MNETTVSAKPSALATLKALSNKKPVPPGNPAAEQAADPAIAGAKRNKNTVTLGFDPSVAEDAAACASYRAALDAAAANFSVFQAKMRDYGKSKRDLYNGLFKASITTVEVPYLDGAETKVVQVICSNRYSVAKDTVLGLKEDMGKHYDLLFEEKKEKVLRPNAEELMLNLLTELGLTGEARDNAMSVLFEEVVKVSAREGYEAEVKNVPAGIRTILDQAVTRADPGLKFPGVGS